MAKSIEYPESASKQRCRYDAGRMMRFTGAVELLKKETLNTRVAEERAFLGDLAGQPIGPITEAFRVTSENTIFWTMNEVLKERDLKRIEF